MKLDLRRVTAAALEAAMAGEAPEPEQRQRPHHNGLRAVVAGAAVATAARFAISKASSLPKLDEILDLKDSIHEKLVDHGWLDDEEDRGYDEEGDYEDAEVVADEEDEPEAEADWEDDGDDADEEDEPEAEYDDEDVDDEADGEPEAGYDDEVEDEGDYDDEDAEEDDEEPEAEESPGLDLNLDDDEDDEAVDPAARPPEPPKKRSSRKTAASGKR